MILLHDANFCLEILSLCKSRSFMGQNGQKWCCPWATGNFFHFTNSSLKVYNSSILFVKGRLHEMMCFVFQQLLDEYPRCFIVGVDNVTSKQMQQIRSSLRNQAVILMGKNTMMRKAIRGHLENNPMLEKWVKKVISIYR